MSERNIKRDTTTLRWLLKIIRLLPQLTQKCKFNLLIYQFLIYLKKEMQTTLRALSP